MKEKTSKAGIIQWIQLLAAILLTVSFFLPWVSWSGSTVKGMDLATGNFFAISNDKFGVSNPFPQLGFLFYVFWLVPLLSLVTAMLALKNNRTVPYALVAGAGSLVMVTVYFLFSRTLIDLGAGNNVMNMLKPNYWIHALAALIIIITAYPVKNPAWKAAWLLVGPLLAFAAYSFGEKYVMGETHEKTEVVKTDYKIAAGSLISEFLANDTAANKKYMEKMLEVNGNVSAVDILPDSSATIKFADSTGSYAIFSFDKEQMQDMKQVEAGQEITIKGVCSGSIYSEILGTTSISFKRSTLKK